MRVSNILTYVTVEFKFKTVPYTIRFYSPETKSIVKSSSGHDIDRGTFETELIKVMTADTSVPTLTDCLATTD